MLFKSLRLKNIRSYVEQRVAFPEGIVLLAGEIGAGKSTILLAIEFALFGLLRSELSGAALLRHGAREGLVELTFGLHGKDYTISRTLKRTKTSVEQDAGFIVENGLRREATAIELKAFILQLLGYPQDLITKSKSMIYRYTVYTPQEDMKKIILEDKESRLMILRKVFDIDKYRRISENTNTYAKLVRERTRAFEGQLVDEPQKKQHLQQKQDEARVVQQALITIQPRITAAKQAVKNHKTALETFEAERSALQQHRATLQATDAELALLLQRKNETHAELDTLTAMLTDAPPPPAHSPEQLANTISQKQQELFTTEQQLREHSTAHAGLKAKKQLGEAIVQKIAALNQCPTCLQQVDAAHKHTLAQNEQERIAAVTMQLATYETSIAAREQGRQRLQQELTALHQQQTAAHAAHMKFQRFQLHQQRKAQLETTLAQLSQSVAAAETRKQQTLKHMQDFAELEKRFLAEKHQLDAALLSEQHVMVEHARLLEQAKFVREAMTLLEQDLAAKQRAREQLARLQSYHHWLDAFFTNLMAVMEKHVMTKVYHDFNALFQRWFALLIEDDVLVARLDEEFSPVVQQNGYDTAVENLSGGEKTACALAYRLALNTVINELHASVHTKDVIILDEPTDGFSADQLARMRDVLEQVKARQIILVSHEAAIESIADHVLRVVKEEHASTMLV